MNPINGNSGGTTASSSDMLSSIHCGYEQLQNTKPKPDATQKTKRRVRFPDDELISDYLEPFRPVPDKCTSEELIAAYLEACFQYKVAPIEFLLEQLKGIDLSICNERYSRLSLKGVRLSRLQVETLEEIFRRVHFRELDFEGTYLDDQSAVAFFDMLLHYETCNELHVTLNLDRLHPSQAWARCVTFLRRSSELRRFALSHTPLSINNFLGLSFFGLCLDSLSLRDCNLSGQALFGLVRWLRLLLSSASLEPPGRDKSSGGSRAHRRHSNGRHTKPTRTDVTRCSNKHPSIWELKLDLAFNKLNVTDAETLLMLIRHQILVPQVQYSSGECQSGNKVSAQACESSSPTPPSKLLPVGGIGFLADLDVSNNNLGDDGLRVICTGLLQCYRGRLRQVHSEQHTVTGQEAVEDVSTLNYSSSAVGTEGAPTPFTHQSEEVALHVRGLERLCVANNGLTASGMQIVTLLLMQTPVRLVSMVGGLVSLDLSNNSAIRDEGVEILCDGLIRNHSLKELYLRAIRMSFTGIFALSGFLSESKCLRMLDIRSNQLDLAGLMALAKTLALNFTLTGFLSDARSLPASGNPLLATDAELILFLIDEIDTCLRRNRGLCEESTGTNSSSATVNLMNSADIPSNITEPGKSDPDVELPNAAVCSSSSDSEDSSLSEIKMNPMAFQEVQSHTAQTAPGNVIQPSTGPDSSAFEDTELVTVNEFITDSATFHSQSDIPAGNQLVQPVTDYVECRASDSKDSAGSAARWAVVTKQLDDHPGAPTQTRKDESQRIPVSSDDLSRFYGQETDIEPSGFHRISLHDESGQPVRVDHSVLANRLVKDVIDEPTRLPGLMQNSDIFHTVEQRDEAAPAPPTPKSMEINQRSAFEPSVSCQQLAGSGDEATKRQRKKKTKVKQQPSTHRDLEDSMERLSTPKS